MTASGRYIARHSSLALVAVVALWWTGRGLPVSPRLVMAEGPLVGTFATARLLLIGLACYWLFLLSLVAVAKGCRLVRMLDGLSRWKLIGGRRAVRLALGVTVGGYSLINSTASFAASGPGPAPVLAIVSNPGATTPPPHPAHPPHHPARTRTSTPVRARLTPTATPVAHRASDPRSWTVRPGDNLWSIAEATLASLQNAPPTERQVAQYWIAVIAANRDRLPVPSDPSLIFAGDVVLLPTPAML